VNSDLNGDSLPANGQPSPHGRPVAFENILDAAGTLKGVVRSTPIMTSRTLDRRTGGSLFLKCENFQRTGAFKIRGATHFMKMLPQSQLQRGVVAHSAGHHAAAVALAAQATETRAVVVVPHNTTAAKVEAVKSYGAEIEFTEPTFDARDNLARKIAAEQGLAFIHPFDDEKVMAGQGTIALEILAELEDLDAILVPVGGGGLISGIGTAIKELLPDCEVIGVEPDKVSYGARSFEQGRLIQYRGFMDSVCEGLLAAPGESTFPIMQMVVDQFLTVSDNDTLAAMRLIWQRMKIIVESSAAITLAAVLQQKSQFEGKRLCLLLTGGNVDLDNLKWRRDT